MAKKPALSRKILVSNRAALQDKYGSEGVKAIERAVDRLAAADRRRGLDTRLLYLDAAALKNSRVTDARDQVENKAAVDAVARKHRPEYLVILGSHDVIPYQDLRNKLYEPGDPDSDDDRFAQSDLPYACEAKYSQDVAKFLGPTRVVGRVPDLTGATKPDYVISLLDKAASARGLKRPESAFAVSAKLWLRSTTMSVRNILGAVPQVLSSPRQGPKFSSAQLREKVHFVNCHGNKSEYRFSGEGPEETYFDALDARKLGGVSTGTVAAFECCYGAELYAQGRLPSKSIAQTYLQKGAVGVVASTTISYGPEDDNANADVICQMFIEQVLRGASLGRAFLEARLGYLRQQSVVDPYDEKTLAQFVLLGDPSLHPFPASPADGAKSAKAKGAEHAARQQRRIRLMKAGERLSRECAYTVPSSKGRPPRASANPVVKSARQRFKNLRRFDVREPVAGRQTMGKAVQEMPKATHIFVATRKLRSSPRSGSPLFEGLLIYQVNGNAVEIKLVSR